MPIPVTIPRLGWTMEEGTFVGWLKAEGDDVRPGDLLFQLEGEKSVEEVEAFDAGVLHIPVDGPKPGDRVAVGAAIAMLLSPGEVRPTAHSPAAAVELPGTSFATSRGEGQGARGKKAGSVELPGTLSITSSMTPGDTRPAVSVTAHEVEAAKKPPGRPTISPRARRLAERHGLDWQGLRGSGRTGRIRERDVVAALSSRHPPGVSGEAEVIPFTSIRQTIAARMAASRRETAPVTLTTTADATNLVNLRAQFKTLARADGCPVPTYNDFLLKLVAAALQQHPCLAARWTDAGLLPASRIDIGLAVDTESGLLVPVVRDVPVLGLRQLAERTRELIELARKGRLPSREMEGGCFTITNLGSYGIETFTPIINLPQCAILGIGRIERQPVLDGDRVVGRERMPLSLTFDHRIVDGVPAARFLQALARLIENPGPWLAT